MKDFAETTMLDDSHQPLRPPALQQPKATPSPIPFPFKSRRLADDAAIERASAEKRRARGLEALLAQARAEGVLVGLRQKASERVAMWLWACGTGIAIGAAVTLVVVLPRAA